MRSAFKLLGVAVLMSGQPALACPPPPPGYVPPTQEQVVERSLRDVTDIAYGVVVPGGVPEKTARFKVLHVYRGSLSKGQTIEAAAGWGHPAPFCLGMMGPPYPKPVGSYGVVAFRNGQRELNFISAEHVAIMIERGWIRSARVRR